MENNKILINRINETDQSWGSLPPIILAAYDVLLEEDTFWDPVLHHTYPLPVWWQTLGNA